MDWIFIVVGSVLPSVTGGTKHLSSGMNDILDAMIEKERRISVKRYQQALMISEAL